MEQIDTGKPWNRTIFVVSPDDPLPPAEDQVMAAAEAGLWRCAYFYRTGGLGYCLEQEPFVPRFFELSQALAKLGCRPFSPRSQPGWKLALGITWFFEIRFDGGPDA